MPTGQLIDLYFRNSDGRTGYDLIIAAATGGPEVHCEAYLSETGEFFSALYNDTEGVGVGVHLSNKVDVTGPLWHKVATPWQLTPEAYAWAKSRVGMPYDLPGAISSATRQAKHDAGKYFCSDIVGELLSRCAMVTPPTPSPLLLPELLCPVGLYLAVTSLVGGEGVATMQEIMDRHYAVRRLASIKVTVMRQ